MVLLSAQAIRHGLAAPRPTVFARAIASQSSSPSCRQRSSSSVPRPARAQLIPELTYFHRTRRFEQQEQQQQHARKPAVSRGFSTTARRAHGHLDVPKPGEERRVTFVDRDGSRHTFEVADGANLLDVAQAHDLEMEGACGGSCACSTCHVIVEDPDVYDRMEEPDDDENDMLDLAFGLTETSRLGCQIKMSKELDGLVVRLPSMTRNLQASDFVKK